ncbi:hypothetical protein CEXT_679551 [Caerostris extrusa]|uniref:Uncharacterized protein n=1 Tax=Caerostris extrusa TaxID=172846 RepID=A0AAV4XWI8_CAEEX|nr:hypothetical protein CEXT_679551 [Caerostris extrusa]
MVWKKYQKRFQKMKKALNLFECPELPKPFYGFSGCIFMTKLLALEKKSGPYKGGGNIAVDFLGKRCYFGGDIIECVYIDCSDIPTSIESKQEGLCFPFCQSG